MNKRVLALLAALITAVICLPAVYAIAAGTDSGAVDNNAVSSPPTTADANYHIVEEDLLRLDVWGEPQFSNMQMQVTPDGKINVPFLGDMKVVDLTQTQVAERIAQKLADQKIVIDAKVQISILSMHRPQVRVLGAVTRPGSFEFKDGDTILDAVAQGGSYTDDAMLESATLTRKGEKEKITIDLKTLLAGKDLSQNYPLKNGDAIYIPHEDYNNKIYVLGQVNRPGQYNLKDKTTLLTAISLAGGQNEKGSIRKTVVIRGDPAHAERVRCNMGALFDKGDLSQDIALKSGDIVLVPGNKKIDWSMISSIINTALNVNVLNRIVNGSYYR